MFATFTRGRYICTEHVRFLMEKQLLARKVTNEGRGERKSLKRERRVFPLPPCLGEEDPRRGKAGENAFRTAREVCRGEIGEINKPGGGRETRFARGGGIHIEQRFLSARTRSSYIAKHS